MSLPDVKLTKVPGLGRRQPSDDYISALVMGGVATTATSTTAALALGTVVELKSPQDAKGYGLNTAYDEANAVLVYHHIARFFKRCPSGTLYVMLVAQGTTLTDMCDATKAYAKTLLNNLQGKVRKLAVVLNPETTYTGTATAGIDADVLTAIPMAQALADEEYDLHRPVDILIEGYHFNGTATAAPDLRALRSPQVSVVIGADKLVSDYIIAAATPFKYYAAVGDTLGTMAQANVNESIGWVDKFNLQDLQDGSFITSCLSSGLALTAYTNTDITTLYDKGYIITRYHADKAGVFFAGAPTCAAIDDDEAFVENSATLNKASRLVFKAYVGDINRPINLNADGTIVPQLVGSLEAKGNTALDAMIRRGEISDRDVVIDPAQDFVANGEKLKIVFRIQIVGVAREIEGSISLVARLRSN
ncbi:hypothetical protein BH09BAC1_BH09BAC1_04960 [soil metagenome]